MSKYTRFKFHKQWLDILNSCIEENLFPQEELEGLIFALVSYGIDSEYLYTPPSMACKIAYSFISREIDKERNDKCLITPKDKCKTKEERFSDDYKVWRKAVFIRDNYTCQCCHQKGGKLEAHHLRPYSKFIDDRLLISNGVTLCKKCHKIWHRKFGINPQEIFLI